METKRAGFGDFRGDDPIQIYKIRSMVESIDIKIREDNQGGYPVRKNITRLPGKWWKCSHEELLFTETQ